MELQFDQATHVYRKGGLIVPNVTRVLDRLSNFNGIPSPVLEYKTDLGRAVHLACALHNEGELDEATCDERTLDYLAGWKRFLLDTGFAPEPCYNEIQVYSRKWGYAGRLDCAGLCRREKWLIDIKTVCIVSPITGLQLAAYEEAMEGKYKRFACQLFPNGSYKLHAFAEKTDFSVFLAELAVYNWRLRKGIK
jgi:hypothetical protein